MFTTLFLLAFLSDASVPGDPASVALSQFGSLGAAGVMGAMWFWERQASRAREKQLDEAHERILGDRVQLEQLIDVLQGNAQALARLTAAQEELVRALERKSA